MFWGWFEARGMNDDEHVVEYGVRCTVYGVYEVCVFIIEVEEVKGEGEGDIDVDVDVVFVYLSKELTG